tara:strand:- start:124 stop:726 length:603 start_codon:yes stop_codon:yes gene_type:complete
MYDNNYPETLKKIIENLSKLSGIGPKTAERLAFNLINTEKDFITNLSNSIIALRDKIKISPICHCLTDCSECSICNDASRKQNIICVVKDQQDVFYIEKSGYKGLYHVLEGLISPLDGVGEEDLNIDNLMNRLEEVDEIILALPFSVEGEATSFLLKDRLKNRGLKISRPAKGLPSGISIEYVDQFTLRNSLEERTEIDG